VEYVFLSEQFYSEYDTKRFPEILNKESRPYILILIEIDKLTFAIPFRSNIHHQNSFITDKTNHFGIDYSKAVVIIKQEYIAMNRTPTVRNEEFLKITKTKHFIINSFKGYLKRYKNAFKQNKHDKISDYKYSTLQYFHKELGLE